MKTAIIPARGGSKRLPGKNTKLLGDKPLIAWTIEAAIESNVFDHVFVSTDSQEIADISKQYGAEVPFLRPEELASDTATTNDVITHLVDWFESEFNQTTSLIAVLQPTSPFRNANHIIEAIEEMNDKSAKAIISVCQLEHPIQFCNQLGSDGSMADFINLENMKRTQDLKPTYRLNGALYIFDRDYVGRMQDLYSEGTYAYIMSSLVSIDIDTQEDFDLAEYLMSKS
ncbi:cytidylyltransferase domain-containing protein [Psychrobacter sanguinis]|uniref:acylneuraminate cytidylyltransferase family protein n=1 Tax=Psychrobacter sanguinis TaxID=861445 RepID=UPI00020C7A24|nr:acylneuraminate cytidylyltransferase family protein [Psychrobacter sanguinis]EGK13932.1 CMP-N-acetylneuraminic acid synthetase NeuA [Psychrobacter sp. 1501(2011)]MCD9150527.1 acylneuraminate cytidylyltransferase family protein [Psychrobacter sanguinis]